MVDWSAARSSGVDIGCSSAVFGCVLLQLMIETARLTHLIAFQSVYSSVAPPYADAHALGPARAPEQASVLPADLPPQALLTSAMLLEFIDSESSCRSRRIGAD